MDNASIELYPYSRITYSPEYISLTNIYRATARIPLYLCLLTLPIASLFYGHDSSAMESINNTKEQYVFNNVKESNSYGHYTSHEI